MRRLMSIALAGLLAATILPGPVLATAGVPATATFSTSPSTSVQGVAFANQPVVHVEDDTPAPVSGVSVTLAIKSGTGTTGAALSCTAAVLTNLNGDATFGGCSIDTVGTGYVLTATAVLDPNPGVSGDSSAFDITPPPPPVWTAAFSTTLVNSYGGGQFPTQPDVYLHDDSAAPVVGAPVTLSITPGSGTAGATLKCTSNTVNTDGAGHATFAGCTIDKAGSAYTLTASGGTSPATSNAFNVLVHPTNTAPTCSTASVTAVMNVDRQGTASCTDAENDPLTYAVSTPVHGTVKIVGNAWTYHADAGFVGTDAFTVTASDGLLTSSPATISITVTNAPAVAYPDVVKVAPVAPTAISVLANDSPGVGDTGQPISITAVTQPSYGHVSIVGATVVYDPAGCFVSNGTTDLFTYTMSDGKTSSTTAVVVTVVQPGQDVTAPAAATLPPTPVSDVPTAVLATGVLGTTVPVKVAWCGVVATSVTSYSLLESTDAGATFPSVYTGTAGSIIRSLVIGTAYAWQVTTTDAANLTATSAASPAYRAQIAQDSQTSTIRFAGRWSVAKGSAYSGGSERYASLTTNSASYTVVGARSFAIVSSKAVGRGSVRVYLDGKLVATVSERASSSQARRIIYVASLAYGPTTKHTIKLVPYGNGRVDLDAILTLR